MVISISGYDLNCFALVWIHAWTDDKKTEHWRNDGRGTK